jgi:hypothetical protein
MYMSTENCGNHGEFLAALYKNIVTISWYLPTTS